MNVTVTIHRLILAALLAVLVTIVGFGASSEAIISIGVFGILIVFFLTVQGNCS